MTLGNAVFNLHIEWRNSKQESITRFGSCFLIQIVNNTYYFITCRHNFPPKGTNSKVMLSLRWVDSKKNQLSEIEINPEDIEPTNDRLDELDISYFRVEPDPNQDIFPLDVIPLKAKVIPSFSNRDAAVIAYFVRSLRRVNSELKYSKFEGSTEQVESTIIGNRVLHRIRFNLNTDKINRGMSGAPLIDQLDGKVIGMVCTRLEDVENEKGNAVLWKDIANFWPTSWPMVEELESAKIYGEFSQEISQFKFHGREEELHTLKSYIEAPQINCISIEGFGGVGKSRTVHELVSTYKDAEESSNAPELVPGSGGWGKTTIAARFISVNHEQYDLIFIHSFLKDQPRPLDLFQELREGLYNEGLLSPYVYEKQGEGVNLAETIFRALSEANCLIIFDNLESILEKSKRGDEYFYDFSPEFQDYNSFIRGFLTRDSKSRLLLTTRVRPKIIEPYIDDSCKVLTLTGVNTSIGKLIMHEVDSKIHAETEEDWIRLVEEDCLGNVLVLELITKFIGERYGGSISDFYKGNAWKKVLDINNEGNSIKGSIKVLEKLLKWYNREYLLDEEAFLLMWLAVSPERMAIDDFLENNLFDRNGIEKILSQISSKIPIGKSPYHLQPVISEFFLTRYHEKASKELIKAVESEAQSFWDTWVNIPVLDPRDQEYIIDDQLVRVLKPISDGFLSSFGPTSNAYRLFLKLLMNVGEHSKKAQPYLLGNLLNSFALTFPDKELNNINLSMRLIWRADLRKVKLSGVNLTEADLKGTAFLSSFGNLFVIAIDPKGEFLVGGSDDNCIYIWEIHSKRLILTQKGHQGWIRSLAFHPSERFIASGGDDTDIILWEFTKTRKLELKLTLTSHKERILNLNFSPNGEFLASSDANGLILIWKTSNLIEGDLSHLPLIRIAFHQKSVWQVKFHPTENILASAGDDPFIYLFELPQDKPFGKIYAEFKTWAIAFSPDGTYFIYGDEQGTINIYKVSDLIEGNYAPFGSFKPYPKFIEAIRFSPTGEDITVAYQDGNILSMKPHPELWYNSLKTYNAYEPGKESWVRSIAITPDDQTIVSSDDAKCIRFWSKSDTDCLHKIQGYTMFIWSTALTSSGKYFYTGDEEGKIRRWELNPMKVKAFRETKQPILENRSFQTTHGMRVRGLAVSPDEQIIASGCDLNQILLHKTDSTRGEPLVVFERSSWVWTLAFHPSQQYLAAAGGDNIIQIYDLNIEQEICRLKGHSAWIRKVIFSLDGKYLISGSDDGNIGIWEVSQFKSSTQTPITLLETKHGRVRGLAIHPANNFLISTGNNGSIDFWDPHNWKNENRSILASKKELWALDTAKDGNYIFSGGKDGTVRAWDSHTQQLLWERESLDKSLGRGEIWTLGANESYVTAAGNDRYIGIWDLEGNPLSTFAIERPYEGTNITDVTGLERAEIDSLKDLGAIEN